MDTPESPNTDEDKAVVFDISPQLEAELLRRAREKGSALESEAAEILERHAEESLDD